MNIASYVHQTWSSMLDEEVLQQTWDLTSKAYATACKKVGYSNNSLRESVEDCQMEFEEALDLSEKLDEVYREIICKLPSHVLQNIITARDNGQQGRGQKTIDNIATELLERELNKDGNS